LEEPKVNVEGKEPVEEPNEKAGVKDEEDEPLP
jgi:hypothetical protein